MGTRCCELSAPPSPIHQRDCIAHFRMLYRKHNKNTTLKIGDKVLKENSKNKHRMGGKLDIRWTGPFIISEDLGKRMFRLKTLAGKTLKQLLKQTVHIFEQET